MRRAITGLAVVVAAVLSSGCLVKVHKSSAADAASAFREARAEIARLQDRPGRAEELNVLVYDPSDREMVRVTIPIWLALKAERHVDWDDADFDDDDVGERVARRLKHRVDLRELEKAGRGMLVEVEEDGGEQVLVWLR
jgi:hypothetical protein